MRRISKKKLIILFTILIAIVAVAISIGLSRALKKEIIQVNIKDSEEKISEASLTIEGMIDEEYHYILLPRVVNNYIVEKYYINDSDMAFENGFIDADSYYNSEDSDKDTTKEDDTTNEEDTSTTENVEERGENGVFYPNDYLMLTPEQIQNKAVTISVKYDYIETEEEGRIYKKELLQDTSYSTDMETFESKGGVEAYAPDNVSVELLEVDQDAREILGSAARSITKNGSLMLYDVYDIKLNVDDEEKDEFDWKKYQDTIKIKIRGLDDNYRYKLFKYDDIDFSLTEVELIADEQGVFFAEVDTIENYVLMIESDSMNAEIIPTEEIGAAGETETDVWTGRTGNSFFAGSGTQTDPYIIKTGEQLKYFQFRVSQLNETFQNQYIELGANIDLAGKDWPPIGNGEVIFQGHFNGSGYTVSNAKLTSSSNGRYGFFGTIGDASTTTTISNLEISGFTISVSQSGNRFEVYAGIIVADMFQNSFVENCIVKNSSINVLSGSQTTINNRNRIFSFGGIAGRICNTYNNPEATPANQSNIINCASDVDIDTRYYTMANTNSYLQYTPKCSTGGIVGTILFHNVFPENCFYTGIMHCNANFAGPIFGAMRDVVYDYSGNVADQFENMFTGNQTLTMTSYYGSYTVYTYANRLNSYSQRVRFTSDNSSGIVPNSTLYRMNTGTVLKRKYEGMNKGLYTIDMNAMLTRFQNRADANPAFLGWTYSNSGWFSFQAPFTVSVTTDENYYLYTAVVTPTGTNYTYKWTYGNTVVNNGNATLNVGFDYNNERQGALFVTDGYFIRSVSFTIPKSIFELTIEYDASTNSITGVWQGNGKYDTSRNDYNQYQWQWYKAELTEAYEAVSTGRTYSPVDVEYDYKLVATLITNTNTKYEAEYTPNRNVVYVSSNGRDSYDGRTPQTPKRTMASAYGLLSSNGTIYSNIIVVIGFYTGSTDAEDTNWMHHMTSTTYNKAATITGKYRGTDHQGEIPLTSNMQVQEGSAVYLNADTRFICVDFDGGTQAQTSWWDTDYVEYVRI